MSDIIFCILKLLPITEVYFSETYVCIYIYITVLSLITHSICLPLASLSNSTL